MLLCKHILLPKNNCVTFYNTFSSNPKRMFIQTAVTKGENKLGISDTDLWTPAVRNCHIHPWCFEGNYHLLTAQLHLYWVILLLSEAPREAQVCAFPKCCCADELTPPAGSIPQQKHAFLKRNTDHIKHACCPVLIPNSQFPFWNQKKNKRKFSETSSHRSFSHVPLSQMSFTQARA